MVKAYKSVGFEFVYEQAVQVVEANFAPYVVEMRRRGVTDVMMVSDVGTQSRLQDAMRQQAFKPEVQDWLSTAYDPAYIVRNGPNAEGTFVQMTTAMLEEADKIPEVAKYLQWADRVDPGGRRDIYGLLGWSASMMFVEGMRAIGPKATRAALIGWLSKLHHWDGGGTGPAVDPAGRLPTDCYMYTTVKNGKFVRLWPTGGGFACGEAGTIDVSKV
jgi:ABC-type branched-subunit amino acid transport system substrate-binding protein